MRNSALFSLLAAGAFALAASPLSADHPAKPAAHDAKSAHAAHWAYEGDAGPDHWGDLEPDFATCHTGKSQSPIDLTHAAAKDLKNLELHYQASQVHELNNGHTVQETYDKGSYLELDGRRYDVVQFHYHAPSEHTVDGKSFPAELHIVHKSAAGKLAVIGILLEQGAENPAYGTFVSNLPSHESEETATAAKVNVAELLPATRGTYRYDGSLTTPPCSEGVKWLVMKVPVALSGAQLGALSKVFAHNNRPVQPLNGRALIVDSTP